MVHQDGWIELYAELEEGREPDPQSVALCMRSRTGLGETMLHWYAIEGDPNVLQRLIDVGFKVNVQNDFGNTPLMEASLIGRWDNVKILLANGARFDLVNQDDEDYFGYMKEHNRTVPEWVNAIAQQDNSSVRGEPRHGFAPLYAFVSCTLRK